MPLSGNYRKPAEELRAISRVARRIMFPQRFGSMLFLARSARAGPIPSRYRISGSFRFQSGRVSVAAQKPAWLVERAGFELPRPVVVKADF